VKRTAVPFDFRPVRWPLVGGHDPGHPPHRRQLFPLYVSQASSINEDVLHLVLPLPGDAGIVIFCGFFESQNVPNSVLPACETWTPLPLRCVWGGGCCRGCRRGSMDGIHRQERHGQHPLPTCEGVCSGGTSLGARRGSSCRGRTHGPIPRSPKPGPSSIFRTAPHRSFRWSPTIIR